MRGRTNFLAFAPCIFLEASHVGIPSLVISTSRLSMSTKCTNTCYTDVNTSSDELEQSLHTILPVRVGWTGLDVLEAGYDETAWAAIRAGGLVHSCGKAHMIKRLDREFDTRFMIRGNETSRRLSDAAGALSMLASRPGTSAHSTPSGFSQLSYMYQSLRGTAGGRLGSASDHEESTRPHY
jgi:hypothetical protein